MAGTNATSVPTAPKADAPGARYDALPARPTTSSLGRWLRRVKPVLWLVVPNVVLLAVVAVEVLHATGGIGPDSQATCNSYGMTCGMAGNALVAFAAGGLAYFLLRGVKVRRALRHYLEVAATSPERLLPRAGYETRPGQLHREATGRLVEDLTRSGPTRLAVVRGGPGTGRRTVLLEVAKRLAEEGWIPVPVSLAESGGLDVLRLARERFVAVIDHLVDSDGEADAVWRQAHGTRSVVVLVEGVDRSPALRPRGRASRNRLVLAVGEALAAGVSLVVASERPLPLEAMEDAREDLNQLDEWAAEDYLVERLAAVDDERRARLRQALDALTDPLEGIQALPFFLNRIADVEERGGLHDLTDGVHQRRIELLDRWVTSLRTRRIDGDALWFASDDPPADLEVDLERRAKAVSASRELARQLLVSGEASAPLDAIREHVSALEDAEALGLVRWIDGRVGFPNGAVRAYFGSRDISPLRLVPAEYALTEGDQERPKLRGSSWMTALLASCVPAQRRDEARVVCGQLLQEGSTGQPAPPDVIATVAHIARCHELSDFYSDLGKKAAAHRDSKDAAALKRLLSALAPIQSPDVHRALWRYADHRHYDVEWAAARALAHGRGAAYMAIRECVEDVLDRAERDPGLATYGAAGGTAYEVGSVAWVLPAVRRTKSKDWQEHWRRTEDLCRSERMHLLRGELSLARGLKLAIIEDPQDAFAITHVRTRLARGTAARFWLSRVLLVQALTIHGERQSERDSVRGELEDHAKSDSHPFVREAAALGTEFLEEDAPRRRWSYVWADEASAVSHIRNQGERLSRLAAEAVVVKSLVVEAACRTDSATDLDLATSADLPHCLGRRLPRNGRRCSCGFNLCDAEFRAAALERTPLTTSFCRQQSRLPRTLAPPGWEDATHTADREAFWLAIADELSRKQQRAWEE